MILEFGMGKLEFGRGNAAIGIVARGELRIVGRTLNYSEYSVYDQSLVSFWSMDIIKSITDSISRYSSIDIRQSSFLHHSLEC